MGWTNQNVIAQLVIVEGENDGLFVYNGSPAAGNLVASIASMAGSDEAGNAYLAGVWEYSNTAVAGFYSAIGFTQTGGGISQINFALASNLSGPWTTGEATLSIANAGGIGVLTLEVQRMVLASTGGYSFTSLLGTQPPVRSQSGFALSPDGLLTTPIETITSGFPVGWSGTISYWLMNDGVSPRVSMDYHLTIANTTVVTNNEALGVSVGSGYFYPTDNKFVLGQINGGGLTGNQFAPLRVDSSGGLHYSGPGFTATSSAFWYGGHTYSVNV